MRCPSCGLFCTQEEYEYGLCGECQERLFALGWDLAARARAGEEDD